MCKVLVFAGTTEGRKTAEFLDSQSIPAHICVATEYGEELLPKSGNMTVSHTRLTEEDMENLMRSIQADPVIDATHPYAAEVTKNIRTACEKTGCRYVRLLRSSRESDQKNDRAVYVSSVDEAAEYLKGTKGNILVTTGSKEIAKYTVIPDYRERVFARVLSLANVAAQCAEHGFEGKNLICMQGPFSKEMNRAMIEQLNCKYLVTKMSGATGGYQEKLDAALETGCTPIVVGRPLVEEGISLAACRRMLCKKFSLHPSREISLVGIGVGSEKLMTLEAQQVLKEAELIIGARRMVEAAAYEGQDTCMEYDSDKICSYIEEHPEYEKTAVVLSGDVGFYSGARKLLEKLSGHHVRVVCGISSLVYFMGKIGRSWDDAFITSAHGRNANLAAAVRTHEKVFAILGSRDGVSVLAGKLMDYGMEHVRLFVGEQLSYEQEKIISGYPKDFISYTGDALSVVYAENKAFVPYPATHGIRDEEFVRDKVPMTKEEVRTVSLAKLGLLSDSVCWDVGAGTGSVSVEMALRAARGRVYAIEKKSLAAELLQKNKMKFAAENLIVVEGEAPGSAYSCLHRRLIRKYESHYGTAAAKKSQGQNRDKLHCHGECGGGAALLKGAAGHGYGCGAAQCGKGKKSRALPYDDGRESNHHYFLYRRHQIGEILYENTAHTSLCRCQRQRQNSAHLRHSSGIEKPRAESGILQVRAGLY